MPCCWRHWTPGTVQPVLASDANRVAELKPTSLMNTVGQINPEHPHKNMPGMVLILLPFVDADPITLPHIALLR